MKYHGVDLCVQDKISDTHFFSAAFEQAANAALASTRKSLYSAADASTAAAALQAIDQARDSLQSAEQVH